MRERLEGHFGADLADVRIHTDPKAVQAARAMGARAFARGEDIFFDRGEFRPHSAAGLELLGHEVAHVQQYRRGALDGLAARRRGGLKLGDAPGLEAEADREARKLLGGAGATASTVERLLLRPAGLAPGVEPIVEAAVEEALRLLDSKVSAPHSLPRLRLRARIDTAAPRAAVAALAARIVTATCRACGIRPGRARGEGLVMRWTREELEAILPSEERTAFAPGFFRAGSRVLLLGEEDFSFAASVARQCAGVDLTATCYTPIDVMRAEHGAKMNGEEGTEAVVRAHGTLRDEIDAQQLGSYGFDPFDTVVFNFPNTRSGIAADQELLRRFFASAGDVVGDGGHVVLSIFDKDIYITTWAPEVLAQGWELVAVSEAERPIYNWDPQQFPGYEHRMTGEAGSAGSAEGAALTFVFERRKTAEPPDHAIQREALALVAGAQALVAAPRAAYRECKAQQSLAVRSFVSASKTYAHLPADAGPKREGMLGSAQRNAAAGFAAEEAMGVALADLEAAVLELEAAVAALPAGTIEGTLRRLTAPLAEGRELLETARALVEQVAPHRDRWNRRDEHEG